jgi:hypothetical protein
MYYGGKNKIKILPTTLEVWFWEGGVGERERGT